MSQLHFSGFRSHHRFTHYLFRFPAKFHPPAIRCLIDRYSKPGESILDPFCGSGTLLVEAVIMGRNAVGVDVDPLAAFISRIKSRPIDPKLLEAGFETLKELLAGIRRPPREYDRLMHKDLSPVAIARWRRALRIPAIPNIHHWFRVYVALDLAKLRAAIFTAPLAPRVRDFFLGCFASVIRNASNADPVPVSGLEVTSYMRQLDERGRRIDPFELFERRVRREIQGMRELWGNYSTGSSRVVCGDAAALRSALRSAEFDVVITSPPYNTAVDYYRRHMLEMYWLDLVRSHEDRLSLAHRYVGRALVRQNNARLRFEFESDYVKRLISHAKRISPSRERVVTHYCASMKRALDQIAAVLKPRGRAVFVVGNSKWNGRRVRATKLLVELADSQFKVAESMSYASRNRYMSYDRHNGANVDREHVVVLQKRK